MPCDSSHGGLIPVPSFGKDEFMSLHLCRLAYGRKNLLSVPNAICHRTCMNMRGLIFEAVGFAKPLAIHRSFQPRILFANWSPPCRILVENVPWLMENR